LHAPAVEVALDAFISHSSKNRTTAIRLESALQEQGLTVWLDDSEIRLGVLLGAELQGSIRDARVVVLLWSAESAESRWVCSEWLTAIHLERFIIPCVLDDTPLPQCLQNNVYLKMRRVTGDAVERVTRAVRDAPEGSNRLEPVMRAEDPRLTDTIGRLAGDQHEVMERLAERDLARAAEAHSTIDHALALALERWPLDPILVDLAGYQLKNAYMIDHWDAVQAGRGPKDPLLDARRNVDSSRRSRSIRRIRAPSTGWGAS
jgi:hypothetical protein